MSALPERRQAIDIEEFERRLRAPEPAVADKDPLAELARLVAGQSRGGGDPLASIFGDAAPAKAPAPVNPPAVEAEPRPEQDPFGDFPDLRPMLRKGEYPGESPDDFHENGMPPVHAAPAVAPPAPEAFHPSSEYEDWAEGAEIPPDAPAPIPPSRSRKPLYVTGAVIAAAFVAIGASLAFRGGAPTGATSAVATIKAASGPTKVQPQTSETADSAPRESTMLDKSAATTPVKKVVTRDEQPLDVNAAAKSPRVIPMAEGAATPAPAGAASVPTPPPPVRTPAAGASVFPEPKKVKTVAVRADGSIISSESMPAAAAPQPPQRPAATAPAAKNATPKSAVRAAGATPAVPAAKPQPAKPPVAAKPAPAPKPKQVAAVAPPAEADDTAADDTVATPTKSIASSGGYSVQLAAPGAEAEARQVAQRLGEKYSGALGGRRPSVQKAADKAVYRVRVTGLSKEGAAGVCEKIKAAGGACFVAR